MIGLIMRVFSYVFHLLLGLVMVAVGFVGWISPNSTFKIGFLPWKDETLAYCLLGFGILGIAVTILAIRKIIPLLFLLWNVAVVVMLVYGFIFSSYHFGMASLGGILGFLAAAILALAGAAIQARSGLFVTRRSSVFA